MSGTNAHVLVEEAPERLAADEEFRGATWLPLLLSARTNSALRATTEAWTNFLGNESGPSFVDSCLSAAVGRAHRQKRIAVVARSRDEAQSKLASGEGHPCVRGGSRPPTGEPGVAFLFTGQGSSYSGMGATLALEPGYAAALERCAEVLKELQTDDVAHQLRSGTFRPEGPPVQVQLGLFCHEYCLASLWREIGVEPIAVMGHSLGEFVAAAVAGALSLTDALRLVKTRAEMLQSRCLPGIMVALAAGEEVVREALRPEDCMVSLAAINGRKSTVIAGEESAVEAVLARIGVAGRRIAVGHAFHSPLVDPMLESFAQEIGTLSVSDPTVEIVSSVTGKLIEESLCDPEHWIAHARNPVRFAGAMETLEDLGCDIYLEVGPGDTLSKLGARLVEGCCIPSTGDREEDRGLAEAIAELWVRGVTFELHRLGRLQGRRVSIPHSIYERQRCWRGRERTLSSLETHSCCANHGTAHKREEKDTMIANTDTYSSSTSKRTQDIVADLSQLLSDLMGIASKDLDPTQPLLELGADSLILVELIRRVEARWSTKLSVRQLFEDLLTVDALARYVDETAPVSAAPRSLHPVRTQPPVAGQHLAQKSNGRPKMSATGLGLSKPDETVRSAIDDSKELPRSQQEALTSMASRLLERTPTSYKIARRHSEILCDGRRSFSAFRPELRALRYPIIARESQGARFLDVDGNEYVDIAMGFGTHIFGHRPAFMHDALHEQLDKGTHLGPVCDLVAEVAELVVDLSGVDRLTFCNTGTEAVMTALRIARAATGRRKIALMRNSYHGHFDGTLVKPELGGQPNQVVPMVNGTPPGMVEDVLQFRMEDPSTPAMVEARASELAAIVMEPVQLRRPDHHPAELIREVRRIATQFGAVLIFDEIVTGFRVHPRGAQGYFGVEADLCTYAKTVANGLPISVIGGHAGLLDYVDGGPWLGVDDPGPQVTATYTGGTFARNPLAMAAARAVLGEMRRRGPTMQSDLNQRTSELAGVLNNVFQDAGVPLQMHNFGSFFRFAQAGNLSFVYPPLELEIFLRGLLSRGIYVWEGATCFLSTEHDDSALNQIVDAVQETVEEMVSAGFWNP